MLRSILLASLAVTGLVNAQTSNPCSVKSTTIQAQSDLDGLSSCTTLSGDLVIGESLVTGTINGIRTIKGSLIAANATALQTLSAPSLTTIGGTFNLTSVTVLRTLDFPLLTSVGIIYWQTLPALSSLTFNAQVTQCGQVTITDTNLQSLQGINLVTVQQFNINNNLFLQEVNVQLTNVTDLLAVEFNGPSVSVSFPNLTWANNATFRSCNQVQLPVLAVVNGSLGFFQNSFVSFKAPFLTAVGTGTQGGDITFDSNGYLTNISMPILTTIYGGLEIANNSAIVDIDGFPELSNVQGSVNITGNFSEVDFPALTNVKGGFNAQTNQTFDCTQLNGFENGVVKGTYFCSGGVNSSNPQGTNPTTNNGGNNSSGNGNGSGSGSGTKNAAGRLSITHSLAVIPVLALLFL